MWRRIIYHSVGLESFRARSVQNLADQTVKKVDYANQIVRPKLSMFPRQGKFTLVSRYGSRALISEEAGTPNYILQGFVIRPPF
jgi:hypothetical protein